MPRDAETGEVPCMKPLLGRLSDLEASEVDTLALCFDDGDLAWLLGVLPAVASLRVNEDSIRYYHWSIDEHNLESIHTFEMQERVFVVDFCK